MSPPPALLPPALALSPAFTLPPALALSPPPALLPPPAFTLPPALLPPPWFAPALALSPPPALLPPALLPPPATIVTSLASPPRGVSPFFMEPLSRLTLTSSPTFGAAPPFTLSALGKGSSAVKLPLASAWMYSHTPVLLPFLPSKVASCVGAREPPLSLTAITEPLVPS